MGSLFGRILPLLMSAAAGLKIFDDHQFDGSDPAALSANIAVFLGGLGMATDKAQKWAEKLLSGWGFLRSHINESSLEQDDQDALNRLYEDAKTGLYSEAELLDRGGRIIGRVARSVLPASDAVAISTNSTATPSGE